MIETLAARVKQAQGDRAGAASCSARRARLSELAAAALRARRRAARCRRERGARASCADSIRSSIRSDAALYQLQAKAYAALGKRLLQHQAQAEVYVLQGSLPAAIEQLQLARGAGDGDFYQLSVVDARLKELRAQHAQEMKDAKR